MAEMTREEAARVLEMMSGDLLNIENANLINKILDALRMGAAALRGWVKTEDRLPEEKDSANQYYNSTNGAPTVLALYPTVHESGVKRWKMDLIDLETFQRFRDVSLIYPHWLSLPALPEVDDA